MKTIAFAVSALILALPVAAVPASDNADTTAGAPGRDFICKLLPGLDMCQKKN